MKNVKLYILSYYFTFMFFSPAHAYLDSGTFSIILQSILATIAGIVATYRLWIFKVKFFFSYSTPDSFPIEIQDQTTVCCSYYFVLGGGWYEVN